MRSSQSYVHGTSDIPLMGLTIGDLLARTAATHGESEALVSRHQGLRYTYAELDHAVDRVARALMTAGIAAGDRVCIPVPLYHCFGMVLGNLACVTHGAAMVYPGEAFDPLAVMETVQEERCTALYGVPTMFIAELEHPEFGRFDYSTLRTGIMAGSPCPVEVMRRVRDQMHMPEVTICYGMTETSPVSFQTRPDDDEEKRVATVGAIHPYVEAKIVDPADDHVVPRGATGELLTRGYPVMLGYWNNDEATAAAIDKARWMHTGDLAVMREDGYVNIVGRIKDLIIISARTVSAPTYPRRRFLPWRANSSSHTQKTL